MATKHAGKEREQIIAYKARLEYCLPRVLDEMVGQEEAKTLEEAIVALNRAKEEICETLRLI